MKTNFLFISILLILSSVKAQSQYVEQNINYSIVKIYQAGKVPFKVKNFTFTNDSLLRYSVNDLGLKYHKEQCSASEIQYIAVKNGNYAVESGLLGGLAGLVGGSLFYLYEAGKLDDIANILDSTGWYFVGCITGGAVIGTLVGISIPKWEVLYIPEIKTSFSISPKANLNYCAMRITINF